MRYWDASAIVPLVVAEEGSEKARAWLAADPVMVTWAWTRVELASSVERRAREGELSRQERRACLDRCAGPGFATRPRSLSTRLLAGGRTGW